MISVNAGRGKDAAWAGRLRRTAIDKRPVPGLIFAGWLEEDRWVKRFADAGRPGAYLRVLQEGVVRAGDRVEVLTRPAERVTLAESMTAYYGDAELMQRLLRVEGRGTKWDEIAVGVLGRVVPARGT